MSVVLTECRAYSQQSFQAIINIFFFLHKSDDQETLKSVVSKLSEGSDLAQISSKISEIFMENLALTFKKCR